MYGRCFYGGGSFFVYPRGIPTKVYLSLVTLGSEQGEYAPVPLCTDYRTRHPDLLDDELPFVFTRERVKSLA